MRLLDAALLLACCNGAAAHSWPAPAGFETSYGEDRRCAVRLLRQFLPNVCFPQSELYTSRAPPQSSGTFDCADNRTVVVHGQCGGLFQCGNGATTDCKNKGRCTCDGALSKRSPCHLNPYTSRQACPPALPFPPMPPPRPPAPPRPPPPPPNPPHPPNFIMHCQRWCHEVDVHHKEGDSHCRCAACRHGDVANKVDKHEGSDATSAGSAWGGWDWDAAKRLSDGAPCRNGRAAEHVEHDAAHKSTNA